jgi:hypothetical protein
MILMMTMGHPAMRKFTFFFLFNELLYPENISYTNVFIRKERLFIFLTSFISFSFASLFLF